MKNQGIFDLHTKIDAQIRRIDENSIVEVSISFDGEYWNYCYHYKNYELHEFRKALSRINSNSNPDLLVEVLRVTVDYFLGTKKEVSDVSN